MGPRRPKPGVLRTHSTPRGGLFHTPSAGRLHSGVLAGAGLRPGPPRVLMHQWGGRGLLHELVLQVCEHGLGGGLSVRPASGLHPALSRTPGLGAKGWRERIHPQSPPEIRTHTEGKATGCPLCTSVFCRTESPVLSRLFLINITFSFKTSQFQFHERRFNRKSNPTVWEAQFTQLLRK